MPAKSKPQQDLRCHNCGHEAPAGETWTETSHPPLGTVTQCRECGSTQIHGRP